MTRTERLPAAAPDEQTDAAAPRPVETLAEAEQLLLNLIGVMDELLAIVEQETRLIRVGRGDTAALLQPSKASLARHYVAAIATLQASTDYLRRALPDALAALRHRHETFRALLQINLTVLAVESAVAEGACAHESAAAGRTALAAREGTARRRLPDARGLPPSIIGPPSRPALPEPADSPRRRFP